MRTRRCSEREPADSLRDKSNVIGGWLPSLTFAFGNNMRLIKFLIIAVLIWFPAAFGLGTAAEAIGIPDTNTWMWILRSVAGAMAAKPDPDDRD